MEKTSAKKTAPKGEILYFPHVQVKRYDCRNKFAHICALHKLADGSLRVLQYEIPKIPER